MRAYWQHLNDREKWVVGIGVIVCVLYIAYLMVYAPLTQVIKSKSRQLQEQRETLYWMQGARAQYKKQTLKKILSNNQLLTLFAHQLHDEPFALFPHELQQTNAGDIQLSFEQVPYNALVSWLVHIGEDYAVSIKQFQVSRTETAGIVKAMIVMAGKKSSNGS